MHVKSSVLIGIMALLPGVMPAGDHATEAAVGSPGLGLSQYRQVLGEQLEGMGSLIPAMVESAEEAARVYLEEDYGLTVMGDPSGYHEAVGRAGGLMNLRGPWSLDRIASQPHVVLFFLRDDHLGDRLHRHFRMAVEHGASGHWRVIGIGRSDLLARAREAGLVMLAELPVSDRTREGLWSGGDEGVVPVSPVLKNVALWMWTGEFLAAATRLGVMPPVYLAFSMPGGDERASSLKGKRFHEESPPAMEAGRIAGRYLEVATRTVEEVFIREETTLVGTASLLLTQRSAGSRLWGFYHSHALVGGQFGYPADPGFLKAANAGWHRLVMDPEGFNGDDWMLCMGFNQPFNSGAWNGLDETLRDRGVNLVWSFAVHSEADRRAVRDAGEILIEQHWPPGDAVVKFEGYDIPILPVSGAISHALLWGLHAEMVWQSGGVAETVADAR